MTVMAGVYGEIDSRIDFHQVLSDAIDIVRRLVAQNPDDGLMLRIEKELNAMRLWTENGRDPSLSERASIDVGLVAARELAEAEGQVGELRSKLFALNNYFEDWPTDAKAANATDDDDDDHETGL
jgi:hypothetical protein